MPTKIDPLFRFLDMIGFVDIFLPFVIVLTIVYAILERTRVLGVEKGHARHQLNAAVAVILALFVVGSSKVLGITTSIVQYAGLFAVIILAVALLLGLFGVQHLPENKWWNAVFFVIIMLVSLSVFYSMGWFGRGSDVFIILFLVFFLLLFVIKVWLKDSHPAHTAAQLPAGQPTVHRGQPPNRNAGPTRQSEHAARAAAPVAQQGRPTRPTSRGEDFDVPFGEEPVFGEGEEEQV